MYSHLTWQRVEEQRGREIGRREKKERERVGNDASIMAARFAHDATSPPSSFYPPAFIFPALRRPPLDLINSV